MLQIRRAQERGRTKTGWLDSRHTFSFGNYYDPDHMGFRALRVINDDRVIPGAGFGRHGHADMEILSYVLAGALEHKDSMGTGSVIRPGEIQMMRAGTGVTHSEFNASKTEPVHFLQIWLLPDTHRLKPSYAQHNVDREAAQTSFALLASMEGRDKSIQIHQDVDLWLGQLEPGQHRTLALRPGRHAWVHLARGLAAINGVQLREGDGLATNDEASLEISGEGLAELLVFDLA